VQTRKKIVFQIIFILVLLGYQPIMANPIEECPTLPRKSSDYLMLSMTKGGTHLLHKLLTMISSNANINVHLIEKFGYDRLLFPPHKQMTLKLFSTVIAEKKNPSMVGHLNVYRHFRKFSKEHPRFKKFIMIRDLRDICVSTVYYLKESLDKHLGPNATFDERLHYVINPQSGFLMNSAFNVGREAKVAIKCMNDPSFVVCRFEELCGAQGGGSQVAQTKQVINVSKTLGIELSKTELNYIINNLWGDSKTVLKMKTFRKGEMGGWKKHFTPAHIDAFNKHLGVYLTKLGYL